ncbi:Zinc ribbon domain protein [compost metagenome]
MPIYEFKCTVCEHVFDDIVKMGTTEQPCEECGEKSTKTINSFLFAAHGLPNGHNAVRTKK